MADESFQPITEAEIATFTALYNYAHIAPTYLPEKDLISGLGRRVCFVGGDTKSANANPPAPIETMLSTLKIGLKEHFSS